MVTTELDDPETIALWSDHGFEPEAARAWIQAAHVRFTPWTARLWIAEGFGPNDAAVWSEVFADPIAARQRRSTGYSDPFDSD